jgi:hypothetical protein
MASVSSGDQLNEAALAPSLLHSPFTLIQDHIPKPAAQMISPSPGSPFVGTQEPEPGQHMVCNGALFSEGGPHSIPAPDY